MGAGTGAGSCCGKAILIITNLLFFVIGLAFFAGGMVLKFPNQLIQPYIDQLLKNLPDIASGASVSNPNSSSGSVTINLDAIIGDIAIAFICIGLFIMIVGILGMCGACCNSRCMLIIYAVILILLLLIQLTVVIIVVTGVFDEKIKTEMKKLINTKYEGTDKFNAESLLMNFFMVQFKCCGVDGYSDFNSSTSWVKTRSVNVTVGGITTPVNVTFVTPIACCKMSGTFPSVTPVDSQCMIHPNSTNSNMDNGCYKAVADFVVTNYKWPVVGAVAGVLVFELLLAIIAIVIGVKAGQDNNKVDSF